MLVVITVLKPEETPFYPLINDFVNQTDFIASLTVMRIASVSVAMVGLTVCFARARSNSHEPQGCARRGLPPPFYAPSTWWIITSAFGRASASISSHNSFRYTVETFGWMYCIVCKSLIRRLAPGGDVIVSFLCPGFPKKAAQSPHSPPSSIWSQRLVKATVAVDRTHAPHTRFLNHRRDQIVRLRSFSLQT